MRGVCVIGVLSLASCVSAGSYDALAREHQSSQLRLADAQLDRAAVDHQLLVAQDRITELDGAHQADHAKAARLSAELAACSPAPQTSTDSTWARLVRELQLTPAQGAVTHQALALAVVLRTDALFERDTTSLSLSGVALTRTLHDALVAARPSRVRVVGYSDVKGDAGWAKGGARAQALADALAWPRELVDVASVGSRACPAAVMGACVVVELDANTPAP